MEQKTKVDFNYTLLDVVGVVWRWRTFIAALTGIVVVGTVIIVLFLSNYYTATATFIPANEEKELFNTEGSRNNSLYGDDDAVDRALIFSNSTPLVGYMVETFELADRYKIDASTPKGQSKVARHFRKLYNVKKNEHSGIEISIQDHEPEKAAEMVDAALKKIAELYRSATASNKNLITKTYEMALGDKRKELKSTSDSLIALRTKYKIYDVEQQGELLSSLVVNTEAQLVESQSKLDAFKSSGKKDSVVAYLAKVKGFSRKMELLNSRNDSLRSAINLHSFNEGREMIMFYDNMLESLNEEIADINTQYTQFKAQAGSKASTLIVLEPTQIPKVKSYPFRSIMVILSAVLAVIFGVIGALLIDMYKKVDWKTVLDEQ